MVSHPSRKLRVKDGAPSFVVGIEKTETWVGHPAYADVLAGVRTSLGRDINFANQGDREAIGNALVQHVRQTGGCDVAGSRANGCSN